MRHAWVISIGTELTLGQTVDTNGAWLAARLAELGIRTLRHVTVADEAEPIRDVLLQAAEAADVVLVSGGLGPTDDDLTRQALAAAVGTPLELHAPSLERLRAFFAARNRVMPERNAMQAMIPRGGRALPNACGTAPGLQIVLHGTPCYVLPGVPYEMEAMFTSEVVPELRAAARGAVLISRRLHVFGPGESEIGQRIADLMQRGRNPEVGTTADVGVVGIRINVAAPAQGAALEQLDAAEAEVRRRLGTAVFGRDDDTLAGVVGRGLAEQKATLATAESCTGGLIGKLITDVPGSSRYYLGGFVCYANETKERFLGVAADDLQRHGAVSGVVARSLAEGAARATGASHALAVTGIAGPTGGTPDKPVGLVFIGVRSPVGTDTHESRFGHDAQRGFIRLRAARTALNLLRLALLGGAAAG